MRGERKMKQSDFFFEKDFPEKYVCVDCREEYDDNVKRCKKCDGKTFWVIFSHENQHCEICGREFYKNEDCFLQYGYGAQQDQYICENCFDDLDVF